jgi:hypothetical protein
MLAACLRANALRLLSSATTALVSYNGTAAEATLLVEDDTQTLPIDLCQLNIGASSSILGSWTCPEDEACGSLSACQALDQQCLVDCRARGLAYTKQCNCLGTLQCRYGATDDGYCVGDLNLRYGQACFLSNDSPFRYTSCYDDRGFVSLPDLYTTPSPSAPRFNDYPSPKSIDPKIGNVVDVEPIVAKRSSATYQPSILGNNRLSASGVIVASCGGILTGIFLTLLGMNMGIPPFESLSRRRN